MSQPVADVGRMHVFFYHWTPEKKTREVSVVENQFPLLLGWEMHLVSLGFNQARYSRNEFFGNVAKCGGF